MLPTFHHFLGVDYRSGLHIRHRPQGLTRSNDIGPGRARFFVVPIGHAQRRAAPTSLNAAW